MAAKHETRSTRDQLHTLEGDIVARDITLSYCEKLLPDWLKQKKRADKVRSTAGIILDAEVAQDFGNVNTNMDMLLDELFIQTVMIEAYDDVGTAATA